jgi:hypothetical protein
MSPSLKKCLEEAHTTDQEKGHTLRKIACITVIKHKVEKIAKKT